MEIMNRHIVRLLTLPTLGELEGVVYQMNFTPKRKSSKSQNSESIDELGVLTFSKISLAMGNYGDANTIT
jgi:hypothetical protein